MNVFHNSYIFTLTQIVHIKMVHISHLITPFFLDAQILGDHYTHVKVFFIKTLGQGARYVSKTSRLNKGHCFRCHK